jgi:hypothetical protein
MTEYKIDPYIWFGKRQVDFCPKHFISASTPLTIDSKQWVLDKLSGRFSVTYPIVSSSLIELMTPSCIAFEDPQEAVFYELKWS